MLKTRLFVKGVSRILQEVPSRNSAYGKGKVAMPGYNDLPQPKMGWKKHYAAQQRKYNSTLGLGVATLLAGLACFAIFVDLHYYPPKNPNG